MEDLIRFFEQLAKFKHTPRRGWALRKVRKPESTADHNFRLLLLGWILPKARNYRLDFDRVLRLIMVHDLYRLDYGDDTPYDFLVKKGDKPDTKIFETWPAHQKEDRIEKNQKEKLEKLKSFISGLPKDIKEELVEIWQEFESGSTKEAKFARQLDRIESLFQAIQYERSGESVKAYPFWREVKEFVDDPLLLEFMEEIDKYYYITHKKKS